MGMSSFQFADRQELRSCFLNRRMRQENGGGKGMGRPSLGKKSEFGTHSTVSSLAFLSDRSVLVGLKNGCVEHWAPEGDSFLPVPGEIQWKRNISIQQHTKQVTCCTVSPREDMFASGSLDKNAVVWWLNKNFRMCVTHEEEVREVMFSSDSKLFFSQTEHSISIWSVQEKEQIEKMKSSTPFLSFRLANAPAQFSNASLPSYPFLLFTLSKGGVTLWKGGGKKKAWGGVRHMGGIRLPKEVKIGEDGESVAFLEILHRPLPLSPLVLVGNKEGYVVVCGKRGEKGEGWGVLRSKKLVSAIVSLHVFPDNSKFSLLDSTGTLTIATPTMDVLSQVSVPTFSSSPSISSPIKPLQSIPPPRTPPPIPILCTHSSFEDDFKKKKKPSPPPKVASFGNNSVPSSPRSSSPSNPHPGHFSPSPAIRPSDPRPTMNPSTSPHHPSSPLPPPPALPPALKPRSHSPPPLPPLPPPSTPLPTPISPPLSSSSPNSSPGSLHLQNSFEGNSISPYACPPSPRYDNPFSSPSSSPLVSGPASPGPGPAPPGMSFKPTASGGRWGRDGGVFSWWDGGRVGLAGVGREEGGLGVLCSIGDLEGAVGLLKGMEKGVERKDLLSGETALFQICRTGFVELFERFLGFGADPKATNNRGDTLIHTAVEYRQGHLLPRLIDLGCDIHCKNNLGNTPLHFAAKNNDGELCDRLVALGSRVNEVDEKWNTALHFAVERGCYESIHSLLINGANPCLRNKDQQSPFSLSSPLPKIAVKRFIKKMAAFFSGGEILDDQTSTFSPSTPSPPSPTSLDLSNCGLNTLPSSISPSSIPLKKMDLSGNPIDFFHPSSLSFLGGVKHLKCEGGGGALGGLMAGEGGGEGVVSWMGSFLKKKHLWKQHQVYLLGSNEAVNWTIQSILTKTKAKSMGWKEGGEGLDGSYDENWDEGEGEGGKPLVRFSWEIGLAEEEEKKSKANNMHEFCFWKFDEKFISGHFFHSFLSQKSVYVLPFDVETTGYLPVLQAWLNYLKRKFGRMPPTIVVSLEPERGEGERDREREREEKEMLAEVKRILQPYKNSCVHVRVCENGLGLEGLISRITEFVLKTKWLFQQLTGEQRLVTAMLQQLRNKGLRYFDWFRFGKICNDCGITKVEDITETYNIFIEIGFILALPGRSQDPIIILSPEWLAEAFCILSLQEEERREGGRIRGGMLGGGVISSWELFEIWRDYFPGVVVEGLMRFLEKQEICYSSFGYEGVREKMSRKKSSPPFRYSLFSQIKALSVSQEYGGPQKHLSASDQLYDKGFIFPSFINSEPMIWSDIMRFVEQSKLRGVNPYTRVWKFEQEPIFFIRRSLVRFLHLNSKILRISEGGILLCSLNSKNDDDSDDEGEEDPFGDDEQEVHTPFRHDLLWKLPSDLGSEFDINLIASDLDTEIDSFEADNLLSPEKNRKSNKSVFSHLDISRSLVDKERDRDSHKDRDVKENKRATKKFEKMRSRPLIKQLPKLQKKQKSTSGNANKAGRGEPAERVFSKFGGRKGETEDFLRGKRSISRRLRELSYIYFDPVEACLFLFHWSSPISESPDTNAHPNLMNSILLAIDSLQDGLYKFARVERWIGCKHCTHIFSPLHYHSFPPLPSPEALSLFLPIPSSDSSASFPFESATKLAINQCLPTNFAEIPQFSFQDCMSVIKGEKPSLVCCMTDTAISVELLAPDLSFVGVPFLSTSVLNKLAKMGEGGSGKIFSATLITSKEKSTLAVVKQFKKLEQEQKFVKCISEVLIMNQLDHPNILRLYGITLSPELSVVIEIAGGGDLHKLLSTERLAVLTADAAVEGEGGVGSMVVPEGELVSVKGSGDLVVMMTRCERCSIVGMCCGCDVCGQWYCGTCRKLSEWKSPCIDGMAHHFEQSHTGLCDSSPLPSPSITTLVYSEKWGLEFNVPNSSLRLFPPSLSDNQLTFSLRLRIALDVARGLSKMHNHVPPIVHRDLRTPNIVIVTLDCNAPVVAKVCDFGHALVELPPSGGELLTWQHLAPEILADSRIFYDHRVDIYAFAMILYEVFTRIPPFETSAMHPDYLRGKDLDNRKCQVDIVSGKLRPSFPLSPPLHDDMAMLIQRCWAQEPEDRPNMSKVVDWLERMYENARREEKGEIRMPLSSLTPSKTTTRFHWNPVNKENPFSSSRYDVFPEFRWTGKIEIPNQANCMLCLEEPIPSMWLGCSDGSIAFLTNPHPPLPPNQSHILLPSSHQSKIICLQKMNTEVVSTDESLATSIWSVQEIPSVLQFFPSPSSSPPSLTLFSGAWILEREKEGVESKEEKKEEKWNLMFSSQERDGKRLGDASIEQGQLTVIAEEKKDEPLFSLDPYEEEDIIEVFSPLCFCVIGEDMWVGGEQGKMAIIPMGKEKERGSGREMREWVAHEGQSVNGLVVVDKKVGGGHYVWSCGRDGCVSVWKGNGRGLLEVIEHKKRGGFVAIDSCPGVVCSASNSKDVLIWASGSRQLLQILSGDMTIHRLSLLCSEQLCKLFLSSEDGKVSVWIEERGDKIS